MSMIRLMRAPLLLSVALGLALPALAQECTQVEGSLTEYVADPFLSPFDTFGRVVAISDGTIQSVGTAVLTTIAPGPTQGTFLLQAKRVLIINQKDQIFAADSVVLTAIPNTQDVASQLTINIHGGIGKFQNATGRINVSGRGFNFFPLPPGPVAGKTYFTYRYAGQVCVP